VNAVLGDANPLDGRARAKLLECVEKIKKGWITVRKLEYHVDTHDNGRLYVEVHIVPTPKGLKRFKRRQHGPR
jgi:hypothetical protein